MNKPVRLLMLLLVALGLGTGQAKAYGETKVNGVKYIDENGEEQTQDNVTVLTGGEIILYAGWYVVNSDITYTGPVYLGGEVHLILCDGAKMNIGTSESRINGDCIGSEGNSHLFIYGQSTGDDMGTLSVYTDHSGIYVDFLTINGGHVIADTNGETRSALCAETKITINGGIVEATATGYLSDAIYAYQYFYYTGGIVTTAASNYAIYAGSSYEFTWRNPTDRITIGDTDLYNQTTTITKRFLVYNDVEDTDASGIVSGTITDLSAFAGKTLRPLAVSETVDGVTTTSPAYCLSVPAGTVVSGKTEADGKTPKPDITIGGKPYYLFKNGDNVTFTLEDRGQDGVEDEYLPIDYAVTDRVPTITFQMRTNDEDVTAKFYIKDTGVKYLDWDDTQKKLVPKNTKDLSPIPKVYMLDGTETTLGDNNKETWYVCNSDVSYDGTLALNGGMLPLYGDVHLILADGAAMTVTNSNAEAISVRQSFTIYAQSEEEKTMGSLTAIGTNGIKATNNADNDIALTINGGKVTTIGTDRYKSIYAETVLGTTNITINGGIVTATGGKGGIVSYSNNTANLTINGGIVAATANSGNAISATGKTANLTVTGGQVKAEASGTYGYGICSRVENGTGDVKATLTLSLTDVSDYIIANNYECNIIVGGAGTGIATATVKIPAGTYLAYTDGDETAILGSADADYIIGEGSNATLNDIAGKRLVPAVPFETDNPYVVKTFDGNWKVAGGAKTFLPTGYDLSAGQVTLAEVKGAPDGQPVIIGLEEGQNLPATFFLVAAQSDEVKGDYDDAVGNMSQRLVFTDGTKTLAEVISGTGVDASEAVILVLDNGRFTSVDFNADDLGKNAKPGLLLFVLSKWEYTQIKPSTQPASAPLNTRAIGIDFGGETTGIEAVLQTTTDPSLLRRGMAGAPYYDLQGRRIAQPTRKGIYIRNGKKTVIK